MTTTNITTGLKDEIIKARDEWDTRNAEQHAKYEAQYAVFTKKQNEIFGDIECKVLAALNEVELPLVVEADTGFSMRRNNVQVRVKSNENNVHGEDKALSWTWEVSLGEGTTVEKKTSSWSGLQATTSEQLESLRQTVKALEILNEINWRDMLEVTLPDWKEHVTERSSIGERPKFEAEIRAAEIAGLIGTNTLIKGVSTGRDSRGTSWYLIISESPKQYKVVVDCETPKS